MKNVKCFTVVLGTMEDWRSSGFRDPPSPAERTLYCLSQPDQRLNQDEAYNWHNVLPLLWDEEGQELVAILPEKVSPPPRLLSTSRTSGPWVLQGRSHKVALVLGGCGRCGASVGLRWMLGQGRGCTKGHQDLAQKLEGVVVALKAEAEAFLFQWLRQLLGVHCLDL